MKMMTGIKWGGASLKFDTCDLDPAVYPNILLIFVGEYEGKVLLF